ncbi:MAG: site-specific integrase [Gemmataceae bacterium]|nr:site-specific integrase [Gemmataceae bacterium]
MPAGRPPRLNWTKSLHQYTVTLEGKLHRLGPDKDEAEKQFRFLLTKHDLAEPVTANPTFAEVADQWLDFVQRTHDADRYRLCKARLNDFLAHLGGDIRVRDLRPRHVEEWIKGKPGVTADGTRRLYKAMILACLNWAASGKVRLIATNPLRGKLELPEGGSRGGDAVWTPEVFQLVTENVNDRFADFLRALAWTGARPSTVRRVEARHYRPQLKLWDVEELYRGRASKRKSVRRIWLPPQMVALVERLGREYPEGPIFRNTKGKPYTPDVITMTMFKLRQRLKRRQPPVLLPEGLTVYGLRHTFATRFIVQHPDKLEYLRELLGHKDLKMIRKHYGHLFDENAALHGVLSELKTL